MPPAGFNVEEEDMSRIFFDAPEEEEAGGRPDDGREKWSRSGGCGRGRCWVVGCGLWERDRWEKGTDCVRIVRGVAWCVRETQKGFLRLTLTLALELEQLHPTVSAGQVHHAPTREGGAQRPSSEGRLVVSRASGGHRTVGLGLQMVWRRRRRRRRERNGNREKGGTNAVLGHPVQQKRSWATHKRSWPR